MKWFILPAGIWILIDKINIPIVQSCGWKLTHDGYIQGSNGKYRDKLLHRIIAEKAGLDVPDQIDHKDGNPRNNLLSNLRPATNIQNSQNSKINSNNTSGYKGVYPYKGKYRAQLDGKYLGTFDTAEKASAVRWAAAKKQHKEFARFE